MRLWIDEGLVAPKGFVWATTFEEVKAMIRLYEKSSFGEETLVLSLGESSETLYKVLKWLKETDIVDRGYFFHVHTNNYVEAGYLRSIIRDNGWKEEKMNAKVLVLYSEDSKVILFKDSEKVHFIFYSWESFVSSLLLTGFFRADSRTLFFFDVSEEKERKWLEKIFEREEDFRLDQAFEDLWYSKATREGILGE